jgi:conjugal transfer/entry exclusion protein
LAAAGTIALSLAAGAGAGAVDRLRSQQLRSERPDRRELQQINNQITSLQNEAQMLINQAESANLPVAAAAANIDPTDPAIAGPGPHCLRVQQIDRAFSTSYGPVTGSQPNHMLMANASRAGRTRSRRYRMRSGQAGVVGNLDTNRVQTSALVTSSQSASGACRCRPAIRSSHFKRNNRRSHGYFCGSRQGAEP